MDRASLQRERALFELCLDRPQREWKAVLAEHCPGDPLLRERILRLLEHHNDTASLEGGFARLTVEDPERIGPYRVVQRLGEGGMGIVYAAEQREPVQRRVAVKVLRVGQNSREVLARFDAERHALSLMTHPNIAHILDAGTTADNRPYIVMEFVPGESITRFSERYELAIDDRLELFRSVCDAIQHAHQKGVIHRDIKPSNILVMEENGRAVPKVIDFGIAKAIAQPLTEHTLETRIGSLLGTPDYMSPEQIDLSPLDVDTRADIYSLGAVLYELLVGEPPLRLDAGKNSFSELQRIAREVEPVPPSHRKEGPFQRQLRGELDWIVMKALQKERGRRYESAAALAEDARRYLAGESTLAGPPSRLRHVRKFIRRHRIETALAATIVGLLVTLSVGMTLQARQLAVERDRANLEAETAQRVTQFTAGLFELVDPYQSGASDVSARTLLDTGVRRLDISAENESTEVRAALYESAGNAYRGLGAYQEAERLLQAAVELRARNATRDPAAHARSLVSLARLKRAQANYPQAEAFSRNAIEIFDSLAARIELAETLSKTSRLDEAASILEGRIKPVTMRSPEFAEQVEGAQALASIRIEQGRFNDAVQLLQPLVEELRAGQEAISPERVALINKLGEAYYFMGEAKLAADRFRETLQASKRIYGERHRMVGLAYNNLGAALSDVREEYAAAEDAYLQALDIHRAFLGAEHIEVATAKTNLGNLYLKYQDWEKARDILRSAETLRAKLLGARHPDTVTSTLGVAVALRNLGELAEAEAMMRDAFSALADSLGEKHWRTGNARILLGGTLTLQDRFAEAEIEMLAGRDILIASLGETHSRTLAANRSLARLAERRAERGDTKAHHADRD